MKLFYPSYEFSELNQDNIIESKSLALLASFLSKPKEKRSLFFVFCNGKFYAWWMEPILYPHKIQVSVFACSVSNILINQLDAFLQSGPTTQQRRRIGVWGCMPFFLKNLYKITFVPYFELELYSTLWTQMHPVEFDRGFVGALCRRQFLIVYCCSLLHITGGWCAYIAWR